MRVLILILVFLAAALSLMAIERFKGGNNVVATSAILEWIQKPAGVRYVGKYDRSYISWVTSSGKIQMRYFDHQSKNFSETQTVDDLYPDFGVESQDDHNAPSLLVLPDGRITAFYTVHDAKGAFFSRTTVDPEDVTRWTNRKDISDENGSHYNYPQAKTLASGDVILFYRRGTYYDGAQYYKTSHDFGTTWEDPVRLIDFNEGGIYSIIDVKDNDLHVAFNQSLTGSPKENIYYIKSPDGGITWQKGDGTVLDLPIAENTVEPVFDSGSSPSFVWDIMVDSENKPYIVFAHGNDPGHEFLMAQVKGERWTITRITDSALLYDSGHFFSGGIVIDRKNPYRVFLSKKRKALEIEAWESFDEGESWQKTRSITENSVVDNFRPQLIENYSSDMRLVFSSGEYEGLIGNEWRGFDKVSVKSDIKTR